MGTAVVGGIVFQALAGNLRLLYDPTRRPSKSWWRPAYRQRRYAWLPDAGYRFFAARFPRSRWAISSQILDPDGLPVKPDGNNVGLDRESRLLAENALSGFSVASNLVRFSIERCALPSSTMEETSPKFILRTITVSAWRLSRSKTADRAAGPESCLCRHHPVAGRRSYRRKAAQYSAPIQPLRHSLRCSRRRCNQPERSAGGSM